MARTTIRTEDIADSEITTAKILDGTIATGDMAVDPTNADNLASGSVPAARLGNVDTSGIVANQDDIALLGFKVAANGSLAKYNLIDQTIDAFEDASGIDASASTDEVRNASNYYSGGGAATGGTETSYGSYTLNTFTSTGTFTPSQSGLADILVVAGGGQGGWNEGGGGGGAGGFKYWSQTTVAAAAHTVTVGVGGDGVSGDVVSGSGGISQFASLSSSTGGGGAGTHGGTPGAVGGSGGGGTGRSNNAGGAGTSNQGNAGGNASTLTGGNDDAGGGGGGASAAGASVGASQNAGNGGAGYTEGATVYDWESGSGTVTFPAAFYNGSTNSSYAGGGGGGSQSASSGTGGTGGGGAGDVNGTPNTGGGGGGSEGSSGSQGSGGSGIVIIRYVTGALGAVNDMTLVSNATTAQDGAPTTGDLVITYTDGAGTATVNTDIKAYISRNGSEYTSAVTLVSQGTTGGHTILTANGVDLSGITTGTSMRWKIETLNQSAAKETRIQAVSLGWS